MSHFQVSQDSDEVWHPVLGFWIRKDSGNSRKGLDKNVKASQDSDEVWHPVFGFWIRKDSGNLRKGLDKKVKASQDSDELLLFYCHSRKLSVVHSNGRNEPKRSISRLERLGWGLDIPIREICSSLWGPPPACSSLSSLSSLSSCRQRAFVETNQASAVKRKPSGPVLIVIHVKVDSRKIAVFAAWS